MNLVAITKRIRACEGEAAAQIVLEHALKEYGAIVRERDAEICGMLGSKCEKGYAYGSECAAAIRETKLP